MAEPRYASDRQRALEVVRDLDYANDIEDHDEDRDCTWCGGSGEGDCIDPLGCLVDHAWNEPCECGACGGSGLRSKQTVF